MGERGKIWGCNGRIEKSYGRSSEKSFQNRKNLSHQYFKKKNLFSASIVKPDGDGKITDTDHTFPRQGPKIDILLIGIYGGKRKRAPRKLSIYFFPSS